MPPKKPRKRRGTSGGAEAQERRRERLEQRRQEKAAALERRMRAERRARIVRAGAYALVGVAVFWFFFLRSSPRPESINGHRLRLFDESQGVQRHVAEGETVDYETTPPAFGPHDPRSLQCGIYSEPQRAELFVHSLEHGAVGLLYDPAKASPDDITTLESIVDDNDFMIAMPFEGMEQPITIVSWGEMMPLEDMDEAAIRDYIDTFRDQGPEANQSCSNAINDPFTPEPSPSPSPSPSPTKTGKNDKGSGNN